MQSDPLVLYEKMRILRSELVDEARTAMLRWMPTTSRRSLRYSALNLAVYRALHRKDLRRLQQELQPWGLAISDCFVPSVLANLDSVLASLSGICCRTVSSGPRRGCHYTYGERRLEQNSIAVLGPCPAGRMSRIMVTLPQAAEEYTFVKQLVGCGMSVARINCAHGSRESWDAMITNIHRAEQETGKLCKILMDLCGTKPRISALLLTGGDGRLNAGDRFLLAKELHLQQDIPVAITCTLPGWIDFLRVGDPVMIDDGSIEAKVVRLVPDGVIVKILRVSPKGSRLKLQKGLNFPRTLSASIALTEHDLSDLNYVIDKADMIGYSFVQEAADIARLQQEIEDRVGYRANAIPIIAKIETARAIDNLPEIIIQGASRQPFGLMIARGDLAVEVGYKQLPNLQEEILWSAKAAHIPTIWATQVLENFVKSGIPARAELTDIAMAARTECIMLNKGPFLPQAVVFLDDFLSNP